MQRPLGSRLTMLWIIPLLIGLALPAAPAGAQTPTAEPTATTAATATTAPTATIAPTATTAPTATAVPTGTAVPTATLAPTLTVGATLTPIPTQVGAASTVYIPLVLNRAGQVETGLQVQNLSGAAAGLTLTYFDQDGRSRPEWVERVNVAANDSYTFYTPGNTNLPAGFVGSAVVQGTQPIGAIVNQQTQPDARPFYVGTFVAPSNPSTTVFLPYALKQVDTRGSTITVQNAGAAATTVDARFYTPDGLVGRVQLFVPALASRRLRLADIGEVPGGMNAAAVLVADQPIVAVGDVYDTATGILQVYTGVSTGAGSQLAPLLFKERGGWDSEIRVQNTTASAVSVRVRVQPTGGGTEITSAAVTVAANAPFTFRPRDLPELPSGLVASAQVEASGNIVAVASEYNVERTTGMIYNAFGPADGTTRISIPLIFKDRNGFDTGVQVQNVDNSDAQVRITYRLSTGATLVEFAVVPAGGSHTFYQPSNEEIPPGSVGSAIVENIAGGQRLVAIVNQVNYARGGDASSTYEGLNY
jgi:hypothetical protein